MQAALLFSAFVIATCGLIYELIAGALASYLLGDSITQFSTIIGVYLFSMGIGSYLSRFINRSLPTFFVQVEFLIGLVGGTSAAILFMSFEWVAYFRLLLYFIVFVTGTLVGIEIPILMRMLKDKLEFKDLVSKVFTFDYVGALFASLLFPLFFVPHLGLVRTGFFFGILNVVVALWTLHLFKDDMAWPRLIRAFGILLLVGLGLGFAYSDTLVSFSETANYHDSIIYAKSSPYQRVVITQAGDDTRLFLNNNLQFSSRDEYRYHEALVHVGMASLPQPKNILVLGGGDGMAVREILKYPSVVSITLVDLDPIVTQLFSANAKLVSLNAGALQSAKVAVVNADAFTWIREDRKHYDFIVVDFPDPSNFSVGKLYSNTFYQTLKSRLAEGGVVSIQSTSPYVAKKSFWCIDSTLRSVGFETSPYHVNVPSFGEWGFLIASSSPFQPPTTFPEGLRFISRETLPSLFEFPLDMRFATRDINRLNNQILVRLFDDEWSAYIH